MAIILYASVTAVFQIVFLRLAIALEDTERYRRRHR